MTESKITPSTLLPLGVAASIFAGAIVLVWQVSDALHAIQDQGARTDSKVDGLRRDVQLWINMAQDLNPDLGLPDFPEER